MQNQLPPATVRYGTQTVSNAEIDALCVRLLATTDRMAARAEQWAADVAQARQVEAERTAP